MFINKKHPIPADAVIVRDAENGFDVTLKTDAKGQAFMLDDLRVQAVMIIEKQYKKSLKKPFVSGAFEYSADPEDLQDLTNAVMSGINQEFKTFDGVLRQYTPPQIKQVLMDATAAKLARVKKRDEQKALIASAANETEINNALAL